MSIESAELILPDGTVAQKIVPVNASGAVIDGGGGSGGSDRELAVVTYFALIALGDGGAAGDTITLTQIIDVTGTPSTVSSIWRNQSTGVDLVSAPTIGTQIELVGQNALTDGQLRASAIDVDIPNVETTYNTATVATDKALRTSAVIHGETTGGGGGYVDVKVNPSGALTTETTLVANSYTDASSTITTGGTAQTILAANSARTGISFQNISDTDMYLNTTGIATAGVGSYLIKAGGTYVTDYGAKDSQAVSLLCATTGKDFTCKWW